MSGGSWDYAFSSVEDLVARLRRDPNPRRRVLGERLAHLPAALKAIEWHDSGDWGAEDEEKAVNACLENMTRSPPALLLAQLMLNEAEKSLADARKILERA